MNPISEAPARLQDHPHNPHRDPHHWQALLETPDLSALACNASVTVDAHARITGASPAGAQLLGRQVESLLGQPLSKLIDHLPFGDNTPGYNLAYAVYHGVGGAWQRHTTATPNGQVVGLDVALSSVMMNGSRAIQLTIKAADSGQPIHCH